MTEDEREIRQVVDTWMQASRAGDVATVLSLMTEDVVFTTPGQEPFGRAEFEAAMRGGGGAQVEGSTEIVELQVNGDWAFTRNRIALTITPPAGAPMKRRGYTLTLFRRDADRRWRLFRDANLATADA